MPKLPLDLQFFAVDDDGGDANDSVTTDDNPQDDDQTNDDPQDGKTFDEEYVKRLRQENAKHRTKNKELEGKLDTVLKALGIKDGEADPDQLAQQLQQKDEEIRRLKVESAFSSVARELGADVDLTLAVLHRKGVLNELDPNDDKFHDDLKKAIKEEVDRNPKLLANVPKKTGATPPDNQGGNGKMDMNTLIRRTLGR